MKILFAPYLASNPYQDLLAGHLSDLGVNATGCSKWFLLPFILRRGRILHLHWLHPFSVSTGLLGTLKKLVRSITQLLVLKFVGIRIVWTAHNLKNHENLRPAFDRFFAAFVAKLADAIIVHSEAAREAVIEKFGRSCVGKVSVIPHGNYVAVYPNTATRKDARRELDLPQCGVVILSFGALRAYKGIQELIEDFKRLPEHAGATLVIAGKPAKDLTEAELREMIGERASIRFCPGFVPADKIQVFMNAADVVALPFRDILTSGSAILAMSFGKAIIAPRLGFMIETLDDRGSFLYDPGESGGLLRAMTHAVEEGDGLEKMGAHNRTLAEGWSWERVAAMTLAVYNRALER